MSHARRFPPPWSATKLLTKDEARPTICQYGEYRF
jgi:hypothetical protein